MSGEAKLGEAIEKLIIDEWSSLDHVSVEAAVAELRQLQDAALVARALGTGAHIEFQAVSTPSMDGPPGMITIDHQRLLVISRMSTRTGELREIARARIGAENLPILDDAARRALGGEE